MQNSRNVLCDAWKKKGKVVFPDSNAPLRKHEDFMTEDNSAHHTKKTIIADLQMDLVEDVALDYMHLTCLGVMRKLICYWVKRDTVNHLFGKNATTTISDRLLDLRKYVPGEFARLPRSLAEIARWKATELRQFLLYTGPIVLKGILPEVLYKHFLCFHVAMKLLSSEEHCRKWNSYCERLLTHFVKESGKLYGPQFISYNVHCLVHLPADVLKFGPVDVFSSFPFENFLQHLKRRERHSKNPLSTLVKRLTELKNVARFKSCSVPDAKLFQLRNKHDKGPLLTSIFGDQYEAATGANWCISIKDPKNRCVFLKDGSIFSVENIIDVNDRVKIVGCEYLNRKPLYETPQGSATVLQAFSVQDVSSLKIRDFNDIKCKAFCMTIFQDQPEYDLSENDWQSEDELYPPAFAVFPMLSIDISR